MPSTRILIADDDPLVRDFLRKALSKAGIWEEIAMAEDGEKALQMLKCSYFDLCILDLYMPGLNGFQVLEEVREKGIQTDIIVLTGYGTIEKGVDAMKLGAQDFQTKPIDIKKVISSAKQLLEKHHPYPHILAEKLDSFVAENAGNSSLNLSDLYTQFNISRSYACRLFQQCMGSTFRARLSFYRVKKAKELIHSTRKPLSDIAEECGFKNPQRLREAFQRLEGMPPKRYREIGGHRRQK